MIPSRKEVLCTAIAVGLLAYAAIAKPKKTPVYYLDFDHFNLTYWNRRYYRFANATMKRMSRHDPIHYGQAHLDVLISIGNNVMVDIYVYEFLSNEYRRSFVESHNKVCEFFDARRAFAKYIEHLPPAYRSCPFPKGVYHFTNLSFPEIPLLSTFPFTQGRLYVNASLWQTGERVMEAYADVAIKQRWQRP